MKNERNFTDNVIAIIQEAARVLWSVAALLAPWLVPVAPAVFFGWTIYQTATNANMPGNYATWAAIAAAVGLETVNIAANHAMLKLSHDYKEHVGKFSLSLLFIIVYVTIGVVAMAMLDVSQGVRIIGIGMFLLAPVAIGAQALTMDLVRVNDKTSKLEKHEQDETRRREQAEADARAWEREQEAEQRRLDHERKLELDRMRWQHKTDIVLAGESPARNGNERQDSGELPEWLPLVPVNLPEFRRLVYSGTITLPEGVTGTKLAELIPAVKNDRTGRHWLKQVKERQRAGNEVT